MTNNLDNGTNTKVQYHSVYCVHPSVAKFEIASKCDAMYMLGMTVLMYYRTDAHVTVFMLSTPVLNCYEPVCMYIFRFRSA